MKKIFVLVLVLVISISSFAQEREIKKTEFDAVYQDSLRNQRLNSYRQITAIEYKVLGKPLLSSFSKSTAEFQPSVGYRSTYVRTGSPKTEIILIGDKLYMRQGNKEWKLQRRESAPSTEILTTTVSNKVKYKYFGSEILNNQNADIYVKMERKRAFHQTTDNESLTIATTKYWFSRDRELLKSESVTEINYATWTAIYNAVTVYELDPNIKIEAPNLN